MSDNKQQDITVLRADTSISTSTSFEPGSGDADAPRVLKQRFVLEEKLGSGGMGTVFRAKDLRKVEARDRQPFLAVKVLNNNFREHPEAFIALQREAAKSQSVSHPNIVSIYDFDKDGDLPFITMELLEGRELADLLRAYPNGLPEEMAWVVIEGLCEGLRHAHEAGIVHADFKPGNVFVAPDNQPKILDFGIARAVQINHAQVSEQDYDSVFDLSRLAALTPAYASREMLDGEDPEPRDDLYSLAVVIYLILTGHHPFDRVPADEAARDELKAEKPKRLSRRRWQAIERCLAFRRDHRFESVADFERHLLNPSPWRSRIAIASAAVLVVALGINAMIGEAELSVVKEEVRQTTMLDVQVARLEGLLQEATFEPGWEQEVMDELVRLEALSSATLGESDGRELTDADRAKLEVGVGIRQDLRDQYTARIIESADLRRAFDLYERGRLFGALETAEVHLRESSIAALSALLDEPRSGDAWLVDVRGALDRVARAGADDVDLARLRLEVADVLEHQVASSTASGQFVVARSMLAELSAIRFDAAVLEALSLEVGSAEALFVDREAQARRKRLLEAASARVVEVLNQSCISFDLEHVKVSLDALTGRHPELAGAIRADAHEKIGSRVAQCMDQLTDLDPDRARSLLQAAIASFGSMPGLESVVQDPCSYGYLVGNGAQSGRGGYCADKLASGKLGPRLVVVPKTGESGSEQRFAITKHEISWNQFVQFCKKTGSCERSPGSGDESLPVTGVTLALVQRYADWLTENTGFQYRLPTAMEWQLAAADDPDPNRNCRMQVDGLQRGLAPIAASAGQGNRYGVVNILGNVQEWVKDGDEIHALGGAYSDPIQECDAKTDRLHLGTADAVTGFRLVREVS